ncbi:MAG: hypothetical protein LKJ60_10520 [Lentilactobacillus buchneri]|nr:hypothetical protein [Lentilactobacillus buchneri]
MTTWNLFKKINYYKDISTTFRCLYILIIFLAAASIFRYVGELAGLFQRSQTFISLLMRTLSFERIQLMATLAACGSAKKSVFSTTNKTGQQSRNEPGFFSLGPRTKSSTFFFIVNHSFIIIIGNLLIGLIFYPGPFLQDPILLSIRSLAWSLPTIIVFTLILSPGVQSGFSKH